MPKCEPVGLDFFDRAAVVERVEVRLAASPADVWAVLNDTEHWPEWFEGMKTARVTSNAWDGVGSTRLVQIGPLKVHEKVVVWEPERHWGFCAVEIGWTAYIAKRLLETLELSPDGDGTRLSYTGAIDPPMLLKPLSKLLAKRMSSSWSEALPHIDAQVVAL